MFFLSVILMLVAITTSGVNGSCPRDNSRRVRSFFLSDVFPALDTEPTDLPQSCPLHPEYDMYRVHEDHKFFDYNSDWKCNYCNKRFVSEKYLDRHMERAHSNLIPANATVCLSDYSKMLGFPPIQEAQRSVVGRVSPAQSAYNKLKKSFGALEKCSVSEVKTLIQKCKDISEACFPASENGEGAPKQQKFNALVCNNLKCVNGVLKGGLHKDTEQEMFVSTIFRAMIVLILIGLVAVQLIFSDSVFHTVRMSFLNKGKRNEDYLHKYLTNSQKYGWFVVTVVDAFYAVKAGLAGWMKPAGKKD